MKFFASALTALAISSPTIAADWDGLPVPADAGAGNIWQLQGNVSDDFNYSAPANGKSQAFYDRWAEGFINAWQGPGLTDYHNPNSRVENGQLVIQATRKPNTDQVYTGAIHSNDSVQYPVYIETRVKIMDQVLANAVWMLSSDSTEEIDIVEAYGSSRPDQTWFAERMHLAHHVFIRDPFQDYQPQDMGAWYSDGRLWREQYSRVGVYWRDPWHLEYYIDGQLVRTVSGTDMIDPYGYTNGTGLSKPMQIIIDAEDQDWRSDNGILATDAELADSSKNQFYVDWVRVYKPVPADDNNDDSDVTVSFDFDSFYATGKEGDAVAGDTVTGFNPSGNGNINFNTLGDWAEYSFNIPEAGDYRLELDTASTVTSGIGADLQIDDIYIGQIRMQATGGWENYQTFSLSNNLTIGAGAHILRVQSSGSAPWQWNGDKIRLIKVGDSTGNNGGNDGGNDNGQQTQVITLEAENFTSTGGTYDGFQTYTQNGVTAINYNQRGDYGEYTLSVPSGGNYIFSAVVATPETGAAMALSLNGNALLNLDVPSTGSWSHFSTISAANAVTLPAGTHTLRITSAGNTSNTWEWNADSFEFSPQ
ncbi:carbohydrate-binding protein [Microbulbifer thermotolerans]|uniref:Carbohydrate-binding protein n=1 Tax=Microbulbifer thermotolerans TaxID=252514 RepID=A0AB35I0N3_MICTH|nr:carbohydrate-binding protein [Microbulbifer thermotolerans]MCX2803323.1 carbohydrate-binding protein [Microbulbifer thermotolerans]MCX2833135.1 carbohydrate-binding protein [Microbulbifer thermotolerans]SFD15892.1 agarase [Microbulbifer thermotolerans]